jgi:hypothetical protein
MKNKINEKFVLTNEGSLNIIKKTINACVRQGLYLFSLIFCSSKIKKLQEQINSLISDNVRLQQHKQEIYDLSQKYLQENITLRHENVQHKQEIQDLSQKYLSLVKENNNLKNQLTIKSNKVQEILQQILLDLFARGLVIHTIDDIYQYRRDDNIIFYKLDPLKGFEVVLQVSSTKDITVLSNDDKYLYFADDSTQSLYPVKKLSETYFRVFRNNKWLVFIKETQNKIIFKEPDNGIYYNGLECKIVDDPIKGPVRIATNTSDYKDMETYNGRVDWHLDWQTEK